MGFHRFAVPSYTGGLPGGYDYINNGASGDPALYDGARSDGGPNNGTYFLGFGENAKSDTVNRGLKALADNTDYLDDLLRRDMAITKRTALVTAAAPVAAIAVTGPGIFVGVPGHPSTSAGLAELFSILDENDDEIIEPSTGVRCKVISITGATVGGNFSSSHVTLTVNPPVPAGKQYRVYYGQRGNLATAAADAFSFITVRAAQEADASFLDLRNMVTRRDGSNNVLALIGSIFETGAGSRIPRSSAMSFDVDPDGGAGEPWSFTFRRNRDASSAVMAQLVEDQTGDIYGLTRWLAVGQDGTNGVGSNGGVLAFFDANTSVDGTAASLAEYIPFTESSNGAGYTRAGNLRKAMSVVRSLNARAYVSVGDGVSTFGDFNGVNAVTDAITAFGSTGTLVIKVKPGTFNIEGTTGPSIPNTLNLVLDGDGPSSILLANTSDGKTFNVTGGKLTLKNLRLQRAGGATFGGPYVTNGQLRVERCEISEQRLDFLNPNPIALASTYGAPTNTANPTLWVDDSTLDMTGHTDITGAAALIRVVVGDGFEHHNFIVRNSVLKCINACPPIKIEAVDSSITESRVRHVHFRNCRIHLGGAESTSGFLNTNPGVAWIDPKNSVRKLGVDDIGWWDCDVWANHLGTSTCSILLHIMPPALDYNSTTAVGLSNIGKLTISGGDWVMPEVDTAICGFTLNARTLKIRQLSIRQSNKLTGAPPKDGYWYFSSSGTPAHSNWGAVTIHSKTETSPPFEKSRDMDIDGIHIRNVLQAQCSVTSGVSDIYIYGPQTGNLIVRDVRVMSPVNGTAAGGFKPYYRMQLYLTSYGGTFENCVWDGSNGTVDGTTWTNNYYLSMSVLGGTTQQGTFRGCGVRGLGTASGAGIVVGTAGQTMVEGGFAYLTSIGLTGYSFHGGGTLSLVGGNYTQNGTYGIFLTADAYYTPNFSLNGVNANWNGSYGLYMTADAFSWVPNQYSQSGTSISVTGCNFVANNGVSRDQVYIAYTGTTGLDNFFNGAFFGNVLRPASSGLTGKLRMTGAPVGTLFIQIFRGLENTAGSIVNNGECMYNYAALTLV